MIRNPIDPAPANSRICQPGVALFPSFAFTGLTTNSPNGLRTASRTCAASACSGADCAAPFFKSEPNQHLPGIALEVFCLGWRQPFAPSTHGAAAHKPLFLGDRL